MRTESYKDSFKGYTYFYDDEYDKYNEKKFNNPHKSQFSKTNVINDQSTGQDKINEIKCFDSNKLSKIKLSSSTNTLVKHQRQSSSNLSNNSTSSSGVTLHRKSGSSINIKY
jgi:hypothetical protein